MKIYPFILTITCAGLACAQQPAAAPQETDVQILKRQMLEMQASIQQMQTLHQQELDSLKAQIEEQKKTIGDFQSAITGGAQPLPAKSAGATSPPGESLFPTTDSSVVDSAPSRANSPASAASAAFPTTDAAVTGAPAASPLAGPITIARGGKNYLNISFDGMFAGAFSTEKHLDRLEVGDHDPQPARLQCAQSRTRPRRRGGPVFRGVCEHRFQTR